MDRHMPGIDGLEATRRIRAIAPAKPPSPRIVAMSACVLAEERQVCAAAGMDGFVAKPYTRQELAEVIGCWKPA